MYIDNFCVAPPYRSSGIGKEIIGYLEEIAKKSNVRNAFSTPILQTGNPINFISMKDMKFGGFTLSKLYKIRSIGNNHEIWI